MEELALWLWHYEKWLDISLILVIVTSRIRRLEPQPLELLLLEKGINF